MASAPKVTLSVPPNHGVRLVFGTMTFAGQVDEKSAVEQLETFFAWHPAESYVELDTAFMYEDTRTEQMLGRILTEEEKSRMRIATKVPKKHDVNPAYIVAANPGHKGGLSALSISTQLTTSLENMKLDSVDIFYLHWPDPKTPLEQSLKRANELYKQGKFRELGVSNYNHLQVAEILSICEAKGFVKPTVYQGMYNMLTRAVEPELFPLLRLHGIRFYAFNPLAGGLLTGKYSSYEDQPIENTRFHATKAVGKRYQDRYWKKCFFDALALIKEAIATHAPEKSLAEVSLTWMHHHSALNREAFDAIIIGQSSQSHLQTNLNSGTQSSEKLPQPILDAIEKAWELVKPDCPPYYR